MARDEKHNPIMNRIKAASRIGQQYSMLKSSIGHALSSGRSSPAQPNSPRNNTRTESVPNSQKETTKLHSDDEDDHRAESSSTSNTKMSKYAQGNRVYDADQQPSDRAELIKVINPKTDDNTNKSINSSSSNSNNYNQNGLMQTTDVDVMSLNASIKGAERNMINGVVDQDHTIETLWIGSSSTTHTVSIERKGNNVDYESVHLPGLGAIPNGGDKVQVVGSNLESRSTSDGSVHVVIANAGAVNADDNFIKVEDEVKPGFNMMDTIDDCKNAATLSETDQSNVSNGDDANVVNGRANIINNDNARAVNTDEHDAQHALQSEKNSTTHDADSNPVVLQELDGDPNHVVNGRLQEEFGLFESISGKDSYIDDVGHQSEAEDSEGTQDIDLHSNPASARNNSISHDGSSNPENGRGASKLYKLPPAPNNTVALHDAADPAYDRLSKEIDDVGHQNEAENGEVMQDIDLHSNPASARNSVSHDGSSNPSNGHGTCKLYTLPAAPKNSLALHDGANPAYDRLSKEMELFRVPVPTTPKNSVAHGRLNPAEKGGVSKSRLGQGCDASDAVNGGEVQQELVCKLCSPRNSKTDFSDIQGSIMYKGGIEQDVDQLFKPRIEGSCKADGVNIVNGSASDNGDVNASVNGEVSQDLELFNPGSGKDTRTDGGDSNGMEQEFDLFKPGSVNGGEQVYALFNPGPPIFDSLADASIGDVNHYTVTGLFTSGPAGNNVAPDSSYVKHGGVQEFGMFNSATTRSNVIKADDSNHVVSAGVQEFGLFNSGTTEKYITDGEAFALFNKAVSASNQYSTDVDGVVKFIVAVNCGAEEFGLFQESARKTNGDTTSHVLNRVSVQEFGLFEEPVRKTNGDTTNHVKGNGVQQFGFFEDPMSIHGEEGKLARHTADANALNGPVNGEDELLEFGLFKGEPPRNGSINDAAVNGSYGSEQTFGFFNDVNGGGNPTRNSTGGANGVNGSGVMQNFEFFGDESKAAHANGMQSGGPVQPFGFFNDVNGSKAGDIKTFPVTLLPAGNPLHVSVTPALNSSNLFGALDAGVAKPTGALGYDHQKLNNAGINVYGQEPESMNNNYVGAGSFGFITDVNKESEKTYKNPFYVSISPATTVNSDRQYMEQGTLNHGSNVGYDQKAAIYTTNLAETVGYDQRSINANHSCGTVTSVVPATSVRSSFNAVSYNQRLMNAKHGVNSISTDVATTNYARSVNANHGGSSTATDIATTSTRSSFNAASYDLRMDHSSSGTSYAEISGCNDQRMSSNCDLYYIDTKRDKYYNESSSELGYPRRKSLASNGGNCPYPMNTLSMMRQGYEDELHNSNRHAVNGYVRDEEAASADGGGDQTVQKMGNGEEGNSDEVDYARRGNWVRAAILGANDGLVSTASLMMGVGAVKGEEAKAMLVSGLAGLVAGACSMAIGEFVSVYSQREAERQAKKRSQMDTTHNQTRQLLSGGNQYESAHQPDTNRPSTPPIIMQADSSAQAGGDDDDSAANPWEAAAASGLFFALGALVPLLSGGFIAGQVARIVVMVFASGAALAAMGAYAARLAGPESNVILGAARVLSGGWGAMLITFVLLRLFGAAGI